MNQLELELQPAEPAYRIISLSQGQVAIVDAEDFEFLSKWKWTACWSPRTKSFYAYRKQPGDRGQKSIYMAREIMQAPKGMMVDHIDRNPLNNRRSNLRIATCLQNNWNKSAEAKCIAGLKGVTRQQYGRWRASITAAGKTLYLGRFDTAELAHASYRAASLELHGEFSPFFK